MTTQDLITACQTLAELQAKALQSWIFALESCDFPFAEVAKRLNQAENTK